MPSPRIFIASHNAEEYHQLLQCKLGEEVQISLASSIDEIASVYDRQAVVLARPDFAAQLLSLSPPIEWLQSTWAGVTPLIEHPYRNYQLTGLKQIFGPQMAEYVIGHVLAHELALERRAKKQKLKHWDDKFSGELQNKVMGVLGTGSIGSYVATMANQFRMTVIGLNTAGTEAEPFAKVFSRNSLADFLQQCDYVVSILPDVPGTTDLFNAESLSAMKDSALLINVGRGNAVVEYDLCEALQNGVIAAAVLDVFREEPLPVSSPLWEVPNLTITGHVAAVSRPSDIAGVFLENYRRFSAGETLNHVVDFNKGY